MSNNSEGKPFQSFGARHFQYKLIMGWRKQEMIFCCSAIVTIMNFSSHINFRAYIIWCNTVKFIYNKHPPNKCRLKVSVFFEGHLKNSDSRRPPKSMQPPKIGALNKKRIFKNKKKEAEAEVEEEVEEKWILEIEIYLLL